MRTSFMVLLVLASASASKIHQAPAVPTSSSLATSALPTCDKFITTNCQPNCTESLTRGCTEARTSNEPDLYRFDGARTH